jgi:hypothetical protein
LASCIAMATWTRLVAPSLVKMWEMCALTVATLMWSVVAISAFDQPRPIAIATSRSRSVRQPTRESASPVRHR